MRLSKAWLRRTRAYSNSFWIPSFAAKFKLADNLACALTYTQPFGADATYGPQAQAAGASIHKEFVSNEFGATCDVNMEAGKGRVHFLGGVFMQDFSYLANRGQGRCTLMTIPPSVTGSASLMTLPNTPFAHS